MKFTTKEEVVKNKKVKSAILESIIKECQKAKFSKNETVRDIYITGFLLNFYFYFF
jgi:phosphorylcholine metabolism protein LicD